MSFGRTLNAAWRSTFNFWHAPIESALPFPGFWRKKTLTLGTSLDKCLQNIWPNGRIGMLSMLMAQDIPFAFKFSKCYKPLRTMPISGQTTLVADVTSDKIYTSSVPNYKTFWLF